MKTIRASHARLAVDIVVFIPWPRLPGESNTQTRPGRIWNLESMESGIVILFVLTSFLASALLFSVQPMIGKMVLPIFGGTPAVWNTCLVFFQGTLLCGYLFSHGMGQTGLTARRRVSGLYLLALAGLLGVSYVMLPVAVVQTRDRPFSLDNDPALDLLGVLCGSATLPLVMVSATAPLVQGWFALIGHPRSDRSVLPLCREQRGKPAGPAKPIHSRSSPISA